MISAKEARERAEAVKRERLADLENCINTAIEKGETQCVYTFPLSLSMQDQLKKAGYSVKNYSNPSDGAFYEIYW